MLADRSPIARLQWWPADRRAHRPARRNRRALTENLADLALVGRNGSASGPASAGNRLAGPLACHCGRSKLILSDIL